MKPGFEDTRIISGKNAVTELLSSGNTVESLLVSKDKRNKSLFKIIGLAKEKGIPIKQVSSEKLDSLSKEVSHQGVIAIASSYRYSSLEDIFDEAKSKNQPPFIVLLDNLEDPHNFGAIIRTVECVGASGVIIPKRRSVGLTSIVERTSAGAVEHVPIVRVSNLANTIDVLKEHGVWVFGAETNEELLYDKDLTGPIAIVIGSEGKGISRIIKEKCDAMVSIPLSGKVSSLNASVAAGVLMYEVRRQRLIKGKKGSVGLWTKI